MSDIELTSTVYVPDNLAEYDKYLVEFYCDIPYDYDNPTEEQVFFCLGHWDNEEVLYIKKVVPIKNIAEDKQNKFEVNPLDYEKYSNLLVAIIHTHPNNNVFPSDEDIKHLPKDVIGGIYQPTTNHVIWWNAYKLDL